MMKNSEKKKSLECDSSEIGENGNLNNLSPKYSL